MPGTSDSKFEAIGPVKVDIAPVLIVVAVTPGDWFAAAHAPLAASGRTAAVALVAGTVRTVPAAMISRAHALVVARANVPPCLVFMASPSFQPVIISPQSGARLLFHDRFRSL